MLCYRIVDIWLMAVVHRHIHLRLLMWRWAVKEATAWLPYFLKIPKKKTLNLEINLFSPRILPKKFIHNWMMNVFENAKHWELHVPRNCRLNSFKIESGGYKFYSPSGIWIASGVLIPSGNFISHKFQLLLPPTSYVIKTWPKWKWQLKQTF